MDYEPAVTRLPRELTLEIITQAVALASHTDPHITLVVSQVCQEWRNSSIATPTLWTKIFVGHYSPIHSHSPPEDQLDNFIGVYGDEFVEQCAERVFSVTAIYLHRSANHLVDLDIHLPPSQHPRQLNLMQATFLSCVLRKGADRLRSIKMFVHSQKMYTHLLEELQSELLPYLVDLDASHSSSSHHLAKLGDFDMVEGPGSGSTTGFLAPRSMFTRPLYQSLERVSLSSIRYPWYHFGAFQHSLQELVLRDLPKRDRPVMLDLLRILREVRRSLRVLRIEGCMPVIPYYLTGRPPVLPPQVPLVMETLAAMSLRFTDAGDIGLFAAGITDILSFPALRALSLDFSLKKGVFDSMGLGERLVRSKRLPFGQVEELVLKGVAAGLGYLYDEASAVRTLCVDSDGLAAVTSMLPAPCLSRLETLRVKAPQWVIQNLSGFDMAMLKGRHMLISVDLEEKDVEMDSD